MLPAQQEIWQPWHQAEFYPQGYRDVALIYLGQLAHRTCFACELPAKPAQPLVDPLQVMHAGEVAFTLVSRAKQLVQWYTSHRFCSSCASPLQHNCHHLVSHCAGCGIQLYPRISPCVIVLVTWGDRVLLAQHERHRQRGLYSTLAGFIEAGETAEAAVHREIYEEVGLVVQAPEYRGSQVWPFPDQLMLGFWAQYRSGSLCIDTNELCDAKWYAIDALPPIPPAYSISHRLIQDYCCHRRTG